MERYRYYSASAGDISSLPLGILGVRYKAFAKVHEDELKLRVRLAGGKS